MRHEIKIPFKNDFDSYYLIGKTLEINSISYMMID